MYGKRYLAQVIDYFQAGLIAKENTTHHDLIILHRDQHLDYCYKSLQYGRNYLTDWIVHKSLLIRQLRLME